MENKMKLDEIRTALAGANLAELVRKTGVHYNTLRNIRDGVIKNPGVNTIEKIAEHLSVKH